MFTGLIEDIGTIRAVAKGANSAKLTVASRKIAEGLAIGDSVAVNGACLTVVRFNSSEFVLDAMPETMHRTNLGILSTGSTVNLERALRQGDRLGGHIVSGHVDGTGIIESFRTEAIATWVYISCSQPLLAQMVPKGSIAIDGVSLTIVDIKGGHFSVSIIPHTKNETTLLSKEAGSVVNLECDILAKYVNAALGASLADSGESQKSAIDLDFLKKNGFA